MLRYLAGVASALLLVLAGFLVLKSRAQSDQIVPPAPQPRAPEERPALDAPPSAEKSREEKRFARYDDNQDGIITRAEMLETRRKPFQKLDVDGNGSLSFEEWAVTTAERFAKADRDRSGTLTAKEFATTRRETRPKRCDC
jgi:hypothetical protein